MHYFTTDLDKKSKKYIVFLSIVLFAFFALRFFCGVNYITADSGSYLRTADLIKSGQYFRPVANFNFGQSAALTMRPFVYPFYLMLFGNSNGWLIIFCQTFVGIFNVFLTFIFYRKVCGKSPGLVTIFLILTPCAFVLVHLMMTEVFATTFTILLAILLSSKLNKRNIFLIQIVITTLAFLKPAFYPFSFISLILFACYFIQLKKFSGLIFIPAILIFCYIGFNKYRTGYASFSSMENINLISFNVKLFKEYEVGEQAANEWENSVYSQLETYKTYKEGSKFLSATGFKEIKNHFWSYSFYHFFCSVRALGDPGRAILMLYFKEEERGNGMNMISNKKGFSSAVGFYFELLTKKLSLPTLVDFLSILLCFVEIIKWSLVIFLLWKKRNLVCFQYLYLIVFVLYGIFISGPVACARYLIPFQGIIICLAALGWEQFKSRKTSTK